jgi:glucokinase
LLLRLDAGVSVSLIGLDIGGTNLKAVRLAPDGAVLAERVRPAGGAIPRAALLDVVSATVAELGGVDAATRVGIAVGGAVQPDGSMKLGSTNLPNLAGIPLAETFVSLLGAPCRVEHDGRAAMRGEAWLGAACGARNAMTLTFGTGIGAGLLLGGRIHQGAHFGAGEIGVWRLLPPPSEGPSPSVEDLVAPGGVNLGRHGRDFAALLDAAPNSPESDGRALVFDLIGRMIANAQLLLDLETVVLIGGVVALGEPFRAAVEDAFVAACPDDFRHGMAVRLGRLGPTCGAIGAAALWREEQG